MHFISSKPRATCAKEIIVRAKETYLFPAKFSEVPTNEPVHEISNNMVCENAVHFISSKPRATCAKEIIVRAKETYLFPAKFSEVPTNEPVHEISNNMVCATSKASDQPTQTRSLIRAFGSRLSIL